MHLAITVVMWSLFALGAVIVCGVLGQEVRACWHYMHSTECRLDTVCRHGVQL